MRADHGRVADRDVGADHRIRPDLDAGRKLRVFGDDRRGMDAGHRHSGVAQCRQEFSLGNQRAVDARANGELADASDQPLLRRFEQ